jgi:hypothetical protein
LSVPQEENEEKKEKSKSSVIPIKKNIDKKQTKFPGVVIQEEKKEVQK